MQWIKASERLPEKAGHNNSVIIRGSGFDKDSFGHHYSGPFVTTGFRNYNEEHPKLYFCIGCESFLTNENIEWLEEYTPSTPPPGESEGGEVDLEKIIGQMWERDNNSYGGQGINPHAYRIGALAMNKRDQSTIISLQQERDAYKDKWERAQKDIAALTEQIKAQ